MSNWRLGALCAQVDLEMFFPIEGGSNNEAKQVCAECPVRTQCLNFALSDGIEFGIWGGLSEKERARVKKGLPPEPTRKRRVRLFPVECGTRAGYRRHLNNGDPTCEPCRKAHAQYKRELRVAA